MRQAAGMSVAMIVAAAAAAAPPSPGEPPRFFGLEAAGEKIVYVCDRSASMAEPAGVPLAEAKRELLASIAALGDSRQFHLIFYNERQSMFAAPGSRGRPLFADEGTLREVRRFVEATSAAGGTQHEQAILTALKLAPDVVFLLTDADATHDLTAAEFERLSERLGRARLMVVQFSGDAGRRSPRLAQLAERSGGGYRVVEPAAAD
jgi:Mg-chelatase subunit ChlD